VDTVRMDHDPSLSGPTAVKLRTSAVDEGLT
jgi:hypothetical protein